MMVFIVTGILFFILTFVLGRYKEKLKEHNQQLWQKALKYIRYISLLLIVAGLLYVPQVQILKIGGWLLIFSLVMYLIFIKNRE